MDAVFSYAGRTEAPLAQPLPTRIGGFGGVPGLVAWLRAERISHVVDATHPFAAQMSRNAVAAAREAGVPLLGLERAPWVAEADDDWRRVADVAGAVAALPESPARVFLAIGRQSLAAFAAKPQHHYLLRLVDPPAGALPLPQAEVIIARGPFGEADDLRLLSDHSIGWIVARNAGGAGAQAKLMAARRLNVPVVMIGRPTLPDRQVAESVDAVMRWLSHPLRLGV